MAEPSLLAACKLCDGPVSKRSTSGFCRRNSECKRKAQAVADARFYAAHREQRLADNAAWRAVHRSRTREPLGPDETSRQRYLARTDRRCLFPAGCDLYAEAGLKYCRPHHNAESNRRYRQKAGTLKQRLAEAQKWICTWCQGVLPVSPSRAHVDHIIPRASGLVIEEEWNYQLLHGRCNQEKSGKITSQAIALAAEHGLTLAA